MKTYTCHICGNLQVTDYCHDCDEHIQHTPRKTPVHQPKTCIQCNTTYTPKTANSKYCSSSCGQKHRYILTNSEKQIQKRNEKAKIPNPSKIQCLLCNGYYTKPMSHVWQVHGMTAREYKEHFELYLSKGVIPEAHKELLRQHAIDNTDTVIKKNLIEKGADHRFSKGHSITYIRTEKHKEDLRKNNIARTRSHIQHAQKALIEKDNKEIVHRLNNGFTSIFTDNE